MYSFFIYPMISPTGFSHFSNSNSARRPSRRPLEPCVGWRWGWLPLLPLGRPRCVVGRGGLMVNGDLVGADIWLVVWNIVFFHSVGNGIKIPTDELIFFRGVDIPPTKYYMFIDLLVYYTMIYLFTLYMCIYIYNCLFL